eukprot:COSAG01_NODE_15172_length_1365_cov_7.147709_1_plen_365_part_00
MSRRLRRCDAICRKKRSAAQPKQLYNFLARQLDAPFRTALRPYLIDGSGQKTVQAVEGDIVTISFVLLDMHEASSWKMKQVMREYYTQAPTKIMSERNIRNCLQKLQQSMAEALRLKVKIDYEVVVRVATTLRYRSPDFTEVCGKYIQRTQDEIRILGIEHDSLGQFDMIIAESIDVCIKCSINEIAGTVNMVDTYLFDSCAEQLDGMSDIGQVFSINSAATPSGTSKKETLVCCCKGCNKLVPAFLCKILIKRMDAKNIDYATHEGLCEDHHKELNIDKTVSELKMKNGKMRKQNKPREPRGVEVETSDIKKMLMAAATELGFTEQPTEAQPASKAFSFSIIEHTRAWCILHYYYISRDEPSL